MVILKTGSLLLGIAIVVATIGSAIRTFVVPRAMADRLSRAVALFWRRLFDLRLKFAKGYVARDRIMAYYAPVTLVSFPLVWLALIDVGFMLIFWATGRRTLGEAYLLSTSSITTLGFATTDVLGERIIVFVEAAIGLVLVALLISYLPTMYSAFSSREAAVTLLDVRAGSPPSAIEMILRAHRIGELHNMTAFWEDWERWFAQVEENHTSLPILVFYRSPVPEYNWVTASGTVLDAAALFQSIVDKKRDPREALCIRAGYLALRRIASFFDVDFNEQVSGEDPISVSRAEFDAACADLAKAGVPLKADLDQGWRDFKGWRVNYDTVLLALCTITMAPYAPWSSDRAQARSRTQKLPLFYRLKNR